MLHLWPILPALPWKYKRVGARCAASPGCRTKNMCSSVPSLCQQRPIAQWEKEKKNLAFMKRLSKGRLKMAGVGTKTREWGGCSGWYNRRSPAYRWDHHSGPFWEIYLPGRGHQRHQSRRVETLSLLRTASRKEELQEVLLLKKPRTCIKRRWLSTRRMYYRTKPPDKIDTYSRNNFDEHKVGILWFRGASGWRLWRLGLDQESGVLEICLASVFKS